MTIAALVAGRPLRVGAVGPAVTAVQLGLRNDGRDLQADGEFGSVETLPAVKAFQASHGLLPTGVVDLATAAAFDKIASPPSSMKAAAVAVDDARAPSL